MSASEQSPEPLAAAILTPLSPKLISVRNSSIVPMLQDQAATTDTATPTPPNLGYPPQQGPVDTMSIDADQDAPAADTIVVGGGEYTDDSQDENSDSDASHASDDSIDYDEDDEVENQDMPGSDAGTAAAVTQNDDYAKSFDSPTGGQSPSEAAGRAQPDVPKASSESIKNNSSSPEQHKSKPLSAESLPARPSSPPTHQANGFLRIAEESKSLPLAVSAVASISKPMSAEDNVNPSPATSDKLNHVAASSADEPSTSPAAMSKQGDGAVDIQKLINNITTRAAASTVASPQASAPPSTAPLATSNPPPSLPPKPSVPALPPQVHSYHHRGSSGPSPTSSLMSMPSQGGAPHNSYMSRAPNDNMPPMPRPSTYASQPHNQSQAHFQTAPNMTSNGRSYHVPTGQRAWETFLVDEKKYTSEQNWDRFPEGSRIFIGNLSSDKVSKREVFDIFSQFGRLAQISLKSAYGFVQYHTIAEGQLAIQRAEGMELGGRRIHLEVSKTQKKDREQSPNRRNARAKPDQVWERDDFRHRSPSPSRRNNVRGSRDSPMRHREFGAISAHERRRSRSPPRHNNRYGNESYRRRSPTPPRRSASFDVDGLDIPRRYGLDVPDVQLLMLPEVSRDFVHWVQQSIQAQGLRTDVMLLNPRFPRDTIVRRMILEGVHAIVDLDSVAQAQGRFDIQIFQRMMDNTTRYDIYKSLDPATAAALVNREKSRVAAYPPNNQPQLYRAEAPAPPVGHPYQQYPQTAAPAAPPVSAPELTNMASQLDNNALQHLLANLQSSQANHAHTASYAGIPTSLAPQQGSPDISELLKTVQSIAGPPQHAAYPNTQAYMGGGAPPHTSAPPPQQQDIQTIMERLRRAAQ